MQQGLLSFDIWDTVLRRKCAPDEDKLAVARYLLLCHFENLKEEYRSALKIDMQRKAAELKIALKNRETGMDDEYSVEDVFSEMLQEILVNPSDNVSALVRELVEVEVGQALRVTYLEEDALSIIQEYPHWPKIYISDFYLGKVWLDRILEKYKDRVIFDNGYVSCDYLLNKKSGRLYELAEQEYAVLPQNHVHYGDSIRADVEAAEKLGIQAHHFLPKENHQKRKILEKNFALRKQGNTDVYFDILKDCGKKTGESTMISCGRYFSLIFYCFVLEIIETAIQKKVKKVYYFTREGEFFCQIHKAIKERNQSDIEIPDCDILEVSRMATFAPSLYDFSREEMKRLWTQYHDQSMESFYKSLNISIEPYEGYFQKYGIDMSERIPNIVEDTRIVQLFSDQEYIEKMKAETLSKRETLKGYLAGKGISPTEKDLFIVDIGWRGSIQDNLALILPQTQIFGYYFGLYDSFYGNIENSHKRGFLSNKRTPEFMWCLKFVDPIEMYTNSVNGSTSGYEKKENGYFAIRDNYEAEDSVFLNYTGVFQKGVLEMIPDLCEIVDTFSLTTAEFKNVALRRLEEFIGSPSKTLSAPYFALSHNENFGKGAVEKKYARFDFGLAVCACFSRKHLNRFVRKIEESHWPQGLFACNYMGSLSPIYNQRVKEQIHAQLEIENNSWCSISEDEFPIQNSSGIQCYVEKALVQINSVEFEGWAVLPGTPSNELQTYLLLENDTYRYLLNTKTMMRKDVTVHFNSEQNYDTSGFICKIEKRKINMGIYRVSVILKGKESAQSVMVKEDFMIRF